MYEYLRAHPQIFMPRIKEPHYFGSDLDMRDKDRSRDEYLALFDGSESARRAGESSVLYLYSRLAAREIHEFNPQARIIIMLREPVSAMISWHGQLVSMAIEPILDFEEAIAAQADRREGKRLPESQRLRSGLQYESVFTYTPQVERYFAAFDRSQIHVIVLDDMIADVAATYARTLRFLDVDESFAPDFAVHNEKKWLRTPALTKFLRGRRGLRRFASRAVPKPMQRWATSALGRVLPSPPRPPVRLEVVNALRARCMPDIARLSGLLGRDLTLWCQPKSAGS